MQSAAEYFDKTRSATCKLFEGINDYRSILRPTIFAAACTHSEDWKQKYDSWCTENKEKIEADIDAQLKYLGEIFAQAVLSGSILQIAAKAIECYSTNTEIPLEWSDLIKPGTKPVPFCIGKLIRGVPLGLIIYAGRNQHIHFEDEKLREPNATIFNKLSLNHEYSMAGSRVCFNDPAFDLKSSNFKSFANNITALIEWRSIEAYEKDMKILLNL